MHKGMKRAAVAVESIPQLAKLLGSLAALAPELKYKKMVLVEGLKAMVITPESFLLHVRSCVQAFIRSQLDTLKPARVKQLVKEDTMKFFTFLKWARRMSQLERYHECFLRASL
jgi:hypothetical protein